jgi:hypothetical protein
MFTIMNAFLLSFAPAGLTLESWTAKLSYLISSLGFGIMGI